MTKRKMKDSGVEWIGEIPEDWEVTKNKYIFEQKKQIVGSDWGNYQLLSLTTGGIIEKDINNLQGKLPESFGTYQVVEKDDLILCLFDLDMSAVFNSKSLFDGMISPAYRRYKLKVEGSINYYNYLFDYIFVDRKYTSYSTTLRFTLDNDEFGDIPTIVPSKSEQIKIAKFLDEKINIVNHNIIKTTDEILKLKEYRKSIITEAVTKGLDRDVPMKDSGIEWIGEIPEHWKIIRGKYILKQLSRPVEDDSEVITCFRDGEVTLRSNRREDGFTVAELEIGYQGITNGDLVIHGMDGFAGAIGISDSNGKGSPVLNVLDSSEYKTYIMYYLRSMAFSDVFTALATGIRVRSVDLRWNKLANLPYPIPPLKEQIKISQYLNSMIGNINKIINTKTKQIETLEEYKKSLIYEYVTGKKEVGRG